MRSYFDFGVDNNNSKFLNFNSQELIDILVLGSAPKNNFKKHLAEN